MIYATDPVTGQKSVSLTILLISLVSVLIAGALNMAGVVSSTSLFSEIFYSSAALYFGRRLTFNNKTFSSDKAEEIEKKVIGNE